MQVHLFKQFEMMMSEDILLHILHNKLLHMFLNVVAFEKKQKLRRNVYCTLLIVVIPVLSNGC